MYRKTGNFTRPSFFNPRDVPPLDTLPEMFPGLSTPKASLPVNDEYLFMIRKMEAMDKRAEARKCLYKYEPKKVQFTRYSDKYYEPKSPKKLKIDLYFFPKELWSKSELEENKYLEGSQIETKASNVAVEEDFIPAKRARLSESGEEIYNSDEEDELFHTKKRTVKILDDDSEVEEIDEIETPNGENEVPEETDYTINYLDDDELEDEAAEPVDDDIEGLY